MPRRDKKSGVRLTGDWKKLDRTLAKAPKRIQEARIQLTKAEAQFFEGEMKRGIANQNPGGRRFKPLSASTLLARRIAGVSSNRALVGLIDEISSRRISGGGWFAGIFDRQAAAIGRIHEEGVGPILIKITPKMRRYLFGVLFKGRPRSGGTSTGVLSITIPARPFVRPVLVREARRNRALRRLLPQYAKVFRGTMGRA